MKFLIIAFYPRILTPYAEQYERIIHETGQEYDILFWDRFSDGGLEKCGREYIFHKKCQIGINRLKKIYPFYLYQKTVRDILHDNQYDKLIVLNTMPAFLIRDVLLKDYRRKFVLDIRDYSYEKYNFYLKNVQNLIDSSFFTTISSRGFKCFLGENNKLIINHNIGSLEIINKESSLFSGKRKIVIGFIGSIRYFEENVKLIEALNGSERYNLFYAGIMSKDCDLKTYCLYKKYQHVKFSGKYADKDKAELYESVDMINSLYGNQKLEVKTALPNRLYDSLKLKKPIIATEGTYLAQIIKKYQLGVVLAPTDSYERKITEYVNHFDRNQFVINSNELLKNVMVEQNYFYEKIREFACEK